MVASFLNKKASSPSSYAGGDCGGSCSHSCCGSSSCKDKKHGAMGISKPRGVPAAHGASEEDEEEPQMQMLPPEGGPSHKLHGKKGGEKKVPLDQSPTAGAVSILAKKGIEDPKVAGIAKLMDAKKAVAKSIASSSKKEARKDEKDPKVSKKASK